jgi:hypothetical protein
MFIDGKKLDLPASLAKRYASDPLTGGVGYGIGKFKCFKIHYWRFSATFSSLGCSDGWMLNYTGLMDEFRIYNAALSDNEVVALYKLEKTIDKVRES